MHRGSPARGAAAQAAKKLARKGNNFFKNEFCKAKAFLLKEKEKKNSNLVDNCAIDVV